MRKDKSIHRDLSAAIQVGIYAFKRIVGHGESFEEVVGLRDKLTGILNEKAFWENTKNAQDGYCMVLVDVDNFKQFNDTYGHVFGDKILKRLAKLISKAMPDQVLAHRLHGDEFILLCVDLDAARQASRIIRENMREGDRVTVSQGICQIDEWKSVEEAFEKADKALYESKRQGRNKITMLSQACIVTL